MTDLEKALALAGNFAGARFVEVKNDQAIFTPFDSEKSVGIPLEQISSDSIRTAVNKIERETLRTIFG